MGKWCRGSRGLKGKLWEDIRGNKEWKVWKMRRGEVAEIRGGVVRINEVVRGNVGK